MKTVAQYAFDGVTKNAEEAKQLFEKSCQAVEAWLAEKGKPNPNGKTLQLNDGRTANCEIARITCASGASAKWHLSEAADSSCFSTTLELASAGAEIVLACNLSTGFTDGAIAPRPFIARCPKGLRDVLRLQPGWRVGTSNVLSSATKFSGPKKVHELVSELISERRTLPIITVSSYEDFILHPKLVDALSADVCGLAIVAQLDDEAAWELTKQIGKEWSCYNGAIRIYWPHLKKLDPRNHPLWTSERLMQRIEGTEHASRRIRGIIRKRLFSVSVFAAEPPLLFGRLEKERSRRAFLEKAELATTADEYKQLAEQYTSENDEVRQQLQQERERVKQLREDLYRLQLTNAWTEADEDIPPVEDTPPDSVEDAVERARREYVQQLTFGDDVADGILTIVQNAGPPAKIYEYLRVLAALVDKRRGGNLGESEIQWLRNNGINASTESETVQNSKNEMKKRMWHDGRNRRKFLTHLKPAEATHPDRCVLPQAE